MIESCKLLRNPREKPVFVWCVPHLSSEFVDAIDAETCAGYPFHRGASAATETLMNTLYLNDCVTTRVGKLDALVRYRRHGRALKSRFCAPDIVGERQ